MDGCVAGTHFKNSYRALTSVGFVQGTRLRQTRRYVRESRDNASVGIEPHQIQRKSHPLHPDRMPVRRLPLQKQTIDFRESVASGRIARTFANATFMAHAPRAKAMAHFERFSDLMMRFRDDVAFVRTVARAAFRAPDLIKAAEGFIADYDAVIAQLTSEGAEPTVARSLAGIASLGAEPVATARKLLDNFEAVLRVVKKTHPGVARSIALSACRASDPLNTAPVHEELRQDREGYQPH